MNNVLKHIKVLFNFKLIYTATTITWYTAHFLIRILKDEKLIKIGTIILGLQKQEEAHGNIYKRETHEVQKNTYNPNLSAEDLS